VTDTWTERTYVQKILFNVVACCEIGHFLCSVISQGKVVALDR